MLVLSQVVAGPAESWGTSGPRMRSDEFGNYTIERPLAKGGMATVFLARHRPTGSRVVLKVLLEQFHGHRDILSRFQREARHLAMLNHENVVSVLDVGVFEGSPFICLEYVEGLDLRTWLQFNGQPPLTVALCLIRDLCLGLEHAHERSILHRDLKPSNFMLTPGGRLRLLDFGLAIMDSESALSLTHPGTVMGTPAYMSPEQAAGEPIGPASDLFSAGCVAFELLTGARPHDGASYSVVMRSLLGPEPLPLIRDRTSEVPESVASRIDELLIKDPKRRCSDLRIVRDAIEAELNRQEVADPHATVASYVTAAERTRPIEPGEESPSVLASGGDFDRAPVADSAPRPRLSGGMGEGSPAVARPAALPPPPAKSAARTAGQPSSPMFGTFGLLVAGVAVALLAIGIAQRNAPIMVMSAGAALLAVRWGRGAARTLEASPAPQRAEAPSEEDIFSTLIRDPAHLPVSVAPSLIRRGAQTEPMLSDATLIFNLPPPVDVPDGFGVHLEVEELRAEPHAPSPATGAHWAADAPEPKLPPVSLVVTSSTGALTIGTRIRVRRSPFVIGRDSDCDLSLETDSSASRRHAELTFHDGSFWLEDLGSRNGIWLDGRRVRERMVLPFDARITIGSVVFSLVHEGADELPPLEGLVLSSQYRIFQVKRRTSRTITCVAQHQRLAKLFVVRLLAPHLAGNPHYLEKFRRESESAAGLTHPHIARIVDAGETQVPGPDGVPRVLHYYCTDLFKRGSLSSRLSETPHADRERVVRWIVDIGSALGCAHRQGLVHAGLKPSSVLLDEDENVYVSDFAFAAKVGEHGGRVLMGSPAFLAPEQWNGAPLGPATDQFALAALAYLMLTGEHPYEGQEYEEIRQRNSLQGPPAAHEVAARNERDKLSPAVSEVLATGLRTDPEARFPSVEAFTAALRKACDQPARMTGAPRVFVSYRRDPSSGWANLIERELRERHGFEVFLDTREIDSAGPFPVRIRQAIERCDVFVVLLSEQTLASDHVLEEIAFAHQQGRPMVPVFQESFRPREHAAEASGAISALLSQDAIHLFDQRNIHVTYTLEELARLVRNTVSRAG